MPRNNRTLRKMYGGGATIPPGGWIYKPENAEFFIGDGDPGPDGKIIKMPNPYTVKAGERFLPIINFAVSSENIHLIGDMNEWSTKWAPKLFSFTDSLGNVISTPCRNPNGCGLSAPSSPGKYTLTWNFRDLVKKTTDIIVVAGPSTTTAAPTTTRTASTTTRAASTTTAAPTTTRAASTTTRAASTTTAAPTTTARSYNLPPCADYTKISPGAATPACDRVTVFGKPKFVEYNFSIPVGTYNTVDEIKKIPGNKGYTIYGGDGNVSFAFPTNKKLKMTINNGPNFSGPITYVYTKTCPEPMNTGSCGQVTWNPAWKAGMFAQSIKVELLSAGGGRRRRTQRSKGRRGSRRH